MKRKALLCAILALTLLFSAQPASALTSNQRATEIEATTLLPVINVVVPASVDIMINPLKMPVSIGGEDSDDQILCSPAYIVSYSNIPLKVDVKVTGSVYSGSDLTLTTSPTNGSGTSKRAFLYFEMQQTSIDDWEYVRWDPTFDASKHINVTTAPHTKNDMVTLPTLTRDGDLPENAYAWFRLAGDAARAPTNEWSTNDGINVTVAFTFTPVSYVQ